MKASEFSSVLATFPGRTIAYEIIERLLHAHLIACANLFPVESSIWCEGKIEQGSEWMAFMKFRTMTSNR